MPATLIAFAYMKFIWLRTRWQGHEPCCICGSVAEGRRAKGDGLNRCLYCWDRLRESEEEGNGKLNKAALATAKLRKQIKEISQDGCGINFGWPP